MENDDKIIKNLVLAKVWNQVLNDDILPDNFRKSIDLNNYVSRLNFIIQSDDLKNPQLNEILVKCNNFVLKKSQLDYHLNFLNKNTQQTDMEIIDISSNEETQQEKEITEKSSEKIPENYINEPVIKINISLNHITSNLLEVKQAIDEENSEQVKKIINDIDCNFDSKSVQIFCINFLNIENFKPDSLNMSNLESTIISIEESQLCFFFENFIQLNSSLTLLSFNISCLFLKFIFSKYILEGMEPNSSNDQISSLLSRRILSLSANICNEFQRQFVVSCLVPFIIEANSKPSNKIFLEFFIKLIKDNLNESGCSELLSILLNEFNSVKWTEIIYSVLSVLVEKNLSLSSENIELILEKMKIDSIDLSKSTVFSKFLLSLLNKLKTEISMKNNKIKINENPSLIVASQLSQTKTNNISIQSDTFEKINEKFIESIEVIIANNKTLIKKTLQNLIKNFKS